MCFCFCQIFLLLCLAFIGLLLPGTLITVALANQWLPQTDTFFKAAIALVGEVPSHEEVDYRRVSQPVLPPEPETETETLCL